MVPIHWCNLSTCMTCLQAYTVCCVTFCWPPAQRPLSAATRTSHDRQSPCNSPPYPCYTCPAECSNPENTVKQEHTESLLQLWKQTLNLYTGKKVTSVLYEIVRKWLIRNCLMFCFKAKGGLVIQYCSCHLSSSMFWRNHILSQSILSSSFKLFIFSP